MEIEPVFDDSALLVSPIPAVERRLFRGAGSSSNFVDISENPFEIIRTQAMLVEARLTEATTRVLKMETEIAQLK